MVLRVFHFLYIINNYNKKKKYFESNPSRAVLDAVQGKRKSMEIDLAKKKYWAEHQAEKNQLEREKNQLNARIVAIDKELDALPILTRIKEADEEEKGIKTKIEQKEHEMASLGIFKGKEKKAIQAIECQYQHAIK